MEGVEQRILLFVARYSDPELKLSTQPFSHLTPGADVAVYTELDLVDFAEISRVFNLGPVISARCIPQGSINTNAFLETSSGRYFVRHTTARSAADLEFEAGLLALLEKAGVPAVRMRRAEGRASIEFKAGRVCVFAFLGGRELSRSELREAHAHQLGDVLARFHLAARQHGPPRNNPYSGEVVSHWLRALSTHDDAEVSSVARELAKGELPSPPKALPRGVIHADLFMDNVKWEGDTLSALFDFEMACQDEWLLDLAITLNAWCFDQGQFLRPLCVALVKGYERVRPLEGEELDALASRMEFGAIRFTASRIRDFHLSPLPPEKLARKDFRTYLARVRSVRAMGPAGVLALVGK